MPLCSLEKLQDVRMRNYHDCFSRKMCAMSFR